MRKLMHKLGSIFFLAILLAGAASGAKAQAVSNPANLNVLLCNGPVGSIAVRYADRWRCLAPGAAGQLYQSNGPAAVGGWYTPTGTGNVTTDGNAVANQFPYFSNATNLAYLSPGGALLDKIDALSSTGFMRRTAANTYSAAAISTSDLPVFAASNVPAFTGNDCNIGAGTLAISCVGMLSQPHTYTAMQTFGGGASFNTYTSGPYGTINLQLNEAGASNFRAGFALGQNWIFGVSSAANTTRDIFFFDSANSRSAWTINPTTDFSTFVGATLNNPLAVGSGGTGTNAAGGAALDNISGFTGTGIIGRFGAASYGTNTLSSYLDSAIGSAQGTIAYRGASGWTGLAPGTSGQFLATNGGGANPSWQSPSAPPAGSRVLINTITATGSTATMTDTTSITTTYKEYEIDFENIVPTGDAQMGVQFYQGGTIQTSGYYGLYNSGSDYNGGVSGTQTTSTNVPMSAVGGDVVLSNARSASSPGMTGRIFLRNNPAVASTGVKQVRAEYYHRSYNGSVNVTQDNAQGGVTLPATSAVTGFQLQTGSVNIASGVIKVYGWN